jgi:hypothetical protein
MRRPEPYAVIITARYNSGSTAPTNWSTSVPLKMEGRPRLEVADIFRAHGEAYRKSHTHGAVEFRAMRDIETCRTAVLGSIGNLTQGFPF